jgi:threonine dehydratase
MTISKEQIIEAHERIKPYVKRTPVHQSHLLNDIAQANLFFKPENLQKTGAFKARGAFNAVFSLPEFKLKKGVATHSSGNHAAALAYAAKVKGIPAYIVMPENAPKNKIEAVKNYGGKIIFCEATQEAREQTLEKVVSQTCATFIHPYNNFEIIKGQATAAKELFEDVNQPLDFIIAPLGGGGLLSGTSLSAKYFSPSTKVIGVEPKGADDAFRSIRDNKIYPSVNPQTIADGLLTSLKKRTFNIIKENVDEILTVEEKTIAEALFLIMERLKLVVEPSAVVTLAAVLENREKFAGKNIGLILSGGNLDFSKIQQYRTLLT